MLRSAVLVVLVLLVALAVLLQTGTAGASEDVGAVPVTYRAVLSGETLWSIAAEVAPDQDRRETIARLVELNALESVAVQAGQRLAVPATS